MKYFIRFLHFYPLVTGPVHTCAISTPRRAYVSPAAISAHWTSHTLSYHVLIFVWVKWSIWGLSVFPKDITSKQCPNISLKILHQAGLETARQAASLTKLRTLTIAPCPSLWWLMFYSRLHSWHSGRAYNPWLDMPYFFSRNIAFWPIVPSVTWMGDAPHHTGER